MFFWEKTPLSEGNADAMVGKRFLVSSSVDTFGFPTLLPEGAEICPRRMQAAVIF